MFVLRSTHEQEIKSKNALIKSLERWIYRCEEDLKNLRYEYGNLRKEIKNLHQIAYPEEKE